MRRMPRYAPSMAAVSGRMPRRAGASTAGVGSLGVRYRTPFTIDSAHFFANDRKYDRLNANAPDHITFTSWPDERRVDAPTRERGQGWSGLYIPRGTALPAARCRACRAGNTDSLAHDVGTTRSKPLRGDIALGPRVSTTSTKATKL
jgi:hypothetical protein